MSIQAVPKFSGVATDDLRKWVHDIKSSIATWDHRFPASKLVQMITYQAFPYDSSSAAWYESCSSKFADLPDDEQLPAIMMALEAHFGYLVQDPTTALLSLKLSRNGDVGVICIAFSHA